MRIAGRSTKAQAEATKKYVLELAENPFISMSDLSEVLCITPQRVRQIIDEAGLLGVREVNRKKYIENMRSGLPKMRTLGDE